MGFLSRLRRGAMYGPDFDGAEEHDASADGERVAGDATTALSAAHSRVVGLRGRMMPPMSRPHPVDGTTSAERTFMDMRRGSND